MPCINCASSTFAAGTTAVVTPALYAAINAGNTPRTERIFPSSDNSPRITTSDIRSAGTVSCADSNAIQIAKSKLDPLFGNHAGDKETVTLRFGHTSPQLTIALRTRSRDSDNAASGKPNNEYPGNPSAISTSTVTTWPSNPRRATDCVSASVIAS